ncbi:MAG TPA: hypothetical protein VJ801_19730 [Polyangia bacterium]|jgi:hypothetical protein|nr:hypothetical protein [Polyangia bacterium]
MLVRPITALRGFVFASVALASLSCANKPPTGGPGTYRGVLVGSSGIGTVQVTVAEAASGPLPASGTIDFGGTAVYLSGTLDQSRASISLSSTTGYHLAGDSRPTYIFGSFESPQDTGRFALFLEPADASPVKLFCGSYTSTTTTSSSPFAVTAVPLGYAICVGPNFVWFGNLDASDSLSCQSGGGLFLGNTNADGGNQWGTGNDYGTWALAPCAAGAADGGVDGGTDNVPDAGAGDSADGDVDY